MIHTVKDFGVVNEAEVDVLLEFSCFFDDPMDVGNFIQWMFQNLATLIAVSEEFTWTLVFRCIMPLIYLLFYFI